MHTKKKDPSKTNKSQKETLKRLIDRIKTI